jgi:hypothetical protein
MMRPDRIGEAAMKSSTLTGIAAVLFAAGLVALIAAIFRSADAHGGLLLWIALALLVATGVCWVAAARVQSSG